MKKLLFQILPLFAVAFVACNDTTEVIPVSEVKVTPTTLTINAGESYQLKAQVLPAEAYYDGIEWKSSNANVASVDNNGRVSAINGGKATISAKVGGVSASCSVTVNVLASSIQLSESELTFVAVGEQVQLTATIEPGNTSDKSVTWSSSDKNVATVTDDGVVTSVDNGEAVITATCGEVSASCTIRVAVAATAVTLSEMELSFSRIGATTQLTATVEPNNVADKTIVWSSSDEEVATVSDEGLVTSVGNGEATITATCGEVSASCTVKVSSSIVTINGTTATFTVTGAGEDAIKEAINKAKEAGATTFVITGDCSALQLATASNVFIGAAVDVLDLSDVTGWETDGNGNAIFPAEAFKEDGSNFSAIKQIILPTDIKIIGQYAFYKCSKLTKVTAEGVEEIGDYCFSNCSSLSEVDMPEVTNVGANAFFMSGITKISFPKVKSLDNAASFWFCSKLVEVNMPECVSIGSIGSGKVGVFSDCSKLVTVNMPKVVTIGDSAFECCSALTDVNMPVATTVGTKAYYKCTSLKTISLPNVTLIKDYAFNNCKVMESIVLSSTDDITITSKSNSLGVYSNTTKNMALTLNTNKQEQVTLNSSNAPVWNGFTWKSVTYVE